MSFRCYITFEKGENKVWRKAGLNSGRSRQKVCAFPPVPLKLMSVIIFLQTWHPHLTLMSRFTLNKIINATLLFLPPFYMSWSERSKTFFSQILFTNLSKSVLVNEIIHPPHRCGISRCWLDSMIIAQMCLRLDTIKGLSKILLDLILCTYKKSLI